MYLLNLFFSLVVGLLTVQGIQGQNQTLNRPPLPNPILLGYANWNQCDEKILQSVEQGCNVIIWFTITVTEHPTTKKPVINGGPDWTCVGNLISRMNKMGYTDVVHLIAIGGWGVDHPPSTIQPQEMMEEFKRWNKDVVARPELGWYGFHGIDWDIEGHDNVQSPYNTLSTRLLDLMGSFSQLLQDQGYYVAMVPLETYLTPSISTFSLSLSHSHSYFHPEYTWHGKNAYAYLLAQYGLKAFDFVTLQLYESYGPMLYNTTVLKQSKADYMDKMIDAYETGWHVDFTTETSTTSLGKKKIHVPPSQLVFGLQNGDWVNDQKTILITADEAGKVFQKARRRGKELRGFAFWSIRDEAVRPNITGVGPLYLAKGLNQYLMVRGNFTQQQRDSITIKESSVDQQGKTVKNQTDEPSKPASNNDGWTLAPSVGWMCLMGFLLPWSF